MRGALRRSTLAEIERQKIAQQMRQAAVRQLLIHFGEVVVLLCTPRVDVEHRETALVLAGRHDPFFVRRHEEPDIIVEPDGIDALRLDLLHRRRDQALKPAFGRFVTRPYCLVGLQQQAARHVRVELTRHVAGIVDQKIVPRKKRTDDLADLGFAGAHFAAQHERDADSFARPLHHVGDQSEDPSEQLVVAAADVILKVVAKRLILRRSGYLPAPQRNRSID